jgi:hypothetical protein
VLEKACEAALRLEIYSYHAVRDPRRQGRTTPARKSTDRNLKIHDYIEQPGAFRSSRVDLTVLLRVVRAQTMMLYES